MSKITKSTTYSVQGDVNFSVGWSINRFTITAGNTSFEFNKPFTDDNVQDLINDLKRYQREMSEKQQKAAKKLVEQFLEDSKDEIL